MIKSQNIIYVFFIIFLSFNILFWNYHKDIQKEWPNIPNAPTLAQANLSFLGNTQLAYRVYATALQNMGSVDGRSISLKDYDYSKLNEWFDLTYALDQKSDIVPLLAAYYFGGIQDKAKLEYVLEYLKKAGSSPEGDKWRWLGHAVYIARHIMKDNERALELAYALSNNESPNLADWAKQMPVYILEDQGNTELAYKIMLNLLITNVDNLHPNELFFMQDYICNTLIANEPSLSDPGFCANLKAP